MKKLWNSLLDWCVRLKKPINYDIGGSWRIWWPKEKGFTRLYDRLASELPKDLYDRD